VRYQLTCPSGNCQPIGRVKPAASMFVSAGPTVTATTWASCASEGGSCPRGRGGDVRRRVEPGVGPLRRARGLVRVGAVPSWGNTKFCEVGSPLLLEATGFQTVAAGDAHTFSVPTTATGGVLMRYGAGNNWVYEVTDVPSYYCSYNDFHDDPAPGQQKWCQIASLPAPATTMGAWQPVVDCTGCSAVSFSVSWGTTRSSSQTTTAEWSTTVTESMESGFKIEGIGTKISASIADTYAHSTSFQADLSTTYGATTAVSCSPLSSSDHMVIYQFVTSTNAACVQASSCTGTTQTEDFVCVHNVPGGFAGPACMPGYCADALCQTCTQN